MLERTPGSRFGSIGVHALVGPARPDATIRALNRVPNRPTFTPNEAPHRILQTGVANMPECRLAGSAGPCRSQNGSGVTDPLRDHGGEGGAGRAGVRSP